MRDPSRPWRRSLNSKAEATPDTPSSLLTLSSGSPANKSFRGGRATEAGVRGLPSPFINLDERGRETPHPSLLPLVPQRKDFLDEILGDDVRVADVLPFVARHLNPLAAFELGHFVHLGLVDGHLAVLVADPEIDVVDLVLGAGDSKIGAGEVVAVVELAHRLVGVDEF